MDLASILLYTMTSDDGIDMGLVSEWVAKPTPKFPEGIV